jgi:hypothetical protein
MNGPGADAKKQLKQFRELARELKCHEDEEPFKPKEKKGATAPKPVLLAKKA